MTLIGYHNRKISYHNTLKLDYSNTTERFLQSLVINLRQNEAEFDKISDDSSELIQISGETKFSASVQQVTSRFQSIQTTAKVYHSTDR